MSKEEFRALAKEYEDQTGFMSFQHMMRKTPAYQSLMAAGVDIVPWIIDGFRAHEKNVLSTWNLDVEFWGMDWVLILMDLTKHTPIQPEPIHGTVFAKWDVDATCKAWIQWADKNSEAVAP